MERVSFYMNIYFRETFRFNKSELNRTYSPSSESFMVTLQSCGAVSRDPQYDEHITYQHYPETVKRVNAVSVV